MGSWIRRLMDPLLGLIFPPVCLACGAGLGEGEKGLCATCRDNVRRITEQRCPACGSPIGPYAPRDERCLNCRDIPLVFQQATAPCRYEGPVRQLVLGLKYGRKTATLHVLTELMAQDLDQADFRNGVDVIVPVPLHWRRRLARGFNQSELLARRLGRRFAIPVCSNRLRRIRETASQTMLRRAERLENLKGAFAAGDGAFEGKTVLLCDDVMTTCATASECARALKAAGAKQIYVAVAAR